MEHITSFLKHALDKLQDVRLDALILYIFGTAYFLFLHWKHDAQIVKGLKGENENWDAPEVVIYFWLQSFPFIVFADAFLGLRLSTEMTVVYTIILLFAIMGRAGVELVIAWKSKITGGFIGKEPSATEEPKN